MWILSKFLWPVWNAYELLNPEQWSMSDQEAKWLADDKAKIAKVRKAKIDSLLEPEKNTKITREQYNANKEAARIKKIWVHDYIKTTWVDDYNLVDKTPDSSKSFEIKDNKVRQTSFWVDWIPKDASKYSVEELEKMNKIATWEAVEQWKFVLTKDVNWKTIKIPNEEYLAKQANINMWNMWWKVTAKPSNADEVSAMISKLKNLKQAPKFLLNIAKKNKVIATLLAWATFASWLVLEWLDDKQKEFDKQQAEWDKKANINSFTWEVETNSKAWDDLAEQTIKETKQELVDTGKSIMEQVKSWELSKEEAREQMWVLKEFASYNFETSIADNLKMKWIDGSYENREKLAKAIWIEWYDWTYEQNIQMLDKLRYLKKDEINNLLGNK